MNSSTKGLFGVTLKDLAEIAILCAMAVGLDRLKIPFPTGSLNLSCVPLIIIALRHGPFKGFIAGGIVFGIITCLIDGYGFITYPMEYLLAFGATGVVGFASPYIIKNFGKSLKHTILSYVFLVASIAVWMVIRYFCACFDSIVLYLSYLEEFMAEKGINSTVLAAMIYNINVPVTALADTIAVCALLYPITLLRKRFQSSFIKSILDEEEPTQDIEVE